MKTFNQPETELAHEAFFDALTSEFIARTGCGAYVFLNPFDVHLLFKDYLKHNMPIREYVKQSVNSCLSA